MPDTIHDTPADTGPDLARQQAIKQIERRRRFWISTVWSAIGMVVLVVIWAVTEYHNAGGWPTQGFSQGSGIHDVWNFWIIYPLGAWLLIVAAHAWATFGRKPISEAEINREIDRQVVPASHDPASPGGGRVVVIGIGNEFRRDDGAGPAVLARLRDRVPSEVELLLTDGEPTRLIEAWTGAALAVIIDAVRAHPPCPGQVHRYVLDRPISGPARTASSHGFGLDDAVRLARALDRMPGRLIVHAIEAADLTQGTGLTPAVAAAIDDVASAVLGDIRDGCPLGQGHPPDNGTAGRRCPPVRERRTSPGQPGSRAAVHVGRRPVFRAQATASRREETPSFR